MKKTPLILLSAILFSSACLAGQNYVQQDGLFAKRITNKSPQDTVLDSLNNNSKILQKRALEEETRSQTRTIEDRRKYREERAQAARKWEEQRRLRNKYKKKADNEDSSSDSSTQDTSSDTTAAEQTEK
jgi:hypothetical protein